VRYAGEHHSTTMETLLYLTKLDLASVINRKRVIQLEVVVRSNTSSSRDIAILVDLIDNGTYRNWW
jgi:hypothetical protein